MQVTGYLFSCKNRLRPYLFLQSRSFSKHNKVDTQGHKATSDVKITPRAVNYSSWYNDVLAASDMMDGSPVRGCIVIKPWGMTIWEIIKEKLDSMIKSHGVQNAYFPLLIPKSFLTKEANHIEGFATECAVVTHSRLHVETNMNNKKDIVVDPNSKLEEPYIIRPTSETIIWHMFSKWIHSHRDLPLRINQWANIIRWEMRTRPFLRTTEFLWQEGHTAHSTKEEAMDMTLKMLQTYTDLCKVCERMATSLPPLALHFISLYFHLSLHFSSLHSFIYE